ncbi:MAG: hypothetical protein IJC78_00570 [Clostridia bacterium]|nr:hypothetical protein [Clostridia bacterium]
MKKALSVILAMLMLLTITPMAFAEVIANGETPLAIAADTETKIDLENYPNGELTDLEGNIAPYTMEVHKNDANSYVFSGGLKGINLTQTLKFNVTEANTYDIEMVYTDADYLSKINVALNGVSVPAFYIAQAIADTTAEDGSTVYYFEKDFAAHKKVFRADLSAGDNTLTITFPERTGSLAGTIAFAADYVSFTPVAKQTPAAVSGNETTTIEAETLTFNTTLAGDMDIYVHNYSTPVVNDSCTAFGFTEKNYNNTPLKMTIPINVEKAGYYDVEAIMNKGESWLSSATLYSSARGKLLTSSGSKYLKATSENKLGGQATGIYGKRTYLPAGEQTLTIDIGTRPEAAPGGIWFLADKISLTPVTHTAEESAVIPAAGGTVEYEDFQNYVNDEIPVTIYNATTAAGNMASGSSFIKFDTGARSYDFYIDIPVYVEKAGFYDLDLIGSSAGSNDLYIDGASVTFTKGTNIGNYDNTTHIGDYYCVKYFPAVQYESRVFLAAGAHTFTTKSQRRANQSYDVANIYDCIMLEPHLPEAVSVSADATASIQLENYTNYISADNTSQLKSNYSTKEYAKGKVLNITEIPTKDGLYINVPITVAEDGKYFVELYASLGNGGYVSYADVKVDGNPVVYNKPEYDLEDLSLDADGNIDYVNNNYKMHRFGAYVDLTAGEHLVTYYAQKRSKYSETDKNQQQEVAAGYYRVTNVVDRIDFTKCENSAVYLQESSSVSVIAYPEKAMTGKAIIALYSGKELVGIKPFDITDAQLISDTVPCSKKPDTAKVFVWKDLENFEPEMESIVLAVQ